MLRDPPGDGGAEGRHVGEHLVAKRRYHVGRGGPDLVLGARLVAGPPDPRRDHGGAVVRGELLVGRVQDRLPGPGVGGVSVNLFFTSFAKQARRSRKGGFTGCANVISPIPVTT